MSRSARDVNLMRSVLFTARLRPCAAAIRMAACVGNRGDDGGLPSGLAIARAYGAGQVAVDRC
jgi:hypothetical protein